MLIVYLPTLPTLSFILAIPLELVLAEYVLPLNLKVIFLPLTGFLFLSTNFAVYLKDLPFLTVLALADRVCFTTSLLDTTH